MAQLFFFLIDRLMFRISNFLRHWYVDVFRMYVDAVLSEMERLDKFFALKISYHNLFKPLYQDKTIFGYFFGFIFRSVRLVVGGLFYAVFIIYNVAIFLIWASIPLLIVFKAMESSGAFGIDGLNIK